MRDLVHNLDPVRDVSPAVINATTKGAAVDTQGFDGAMATVVGGAIVGAGLVLPSLEESDTTTDGDFTAIAAGNLQGAFVNMTANSIQKVGVKSSKRYIRVVLTLVSGTSILGSATITRGFPSQLPVGGLE